MPNRGWTGITGRVYLHLDGARRIGATGVTPRAVLHAVGASAGGSSDLISRAVSKGLSDALGASFPVINREGANGALAAAEVANAEPNGKVIAIQNASLFAITPLAVAPDEVTNIDDFDVVQGVSRDDYDEG